MPPLCLDAAICLDAPPVCLNATLCLNTYIWTPLYVWMIMLDTFICLDAHLYVWTYPICLQFESAPVCLGAPYLWTPLCMVNIPTCSDTPCMFGYLHMFGFPLCVWMWVSKHMIVPKCIRDIQNKQHKESMLSQLRGCPYAPIDLDATICLDTTCVLGCHL